MPATLLFHAQSHRWLLLQRRPCNQVVVKASHARLPRSYELERRRLLAGETGTSSVD